MKRPMQVYRSWTTKHARLSAQRRGLLEGGYLAFMDWPPHLAGHEAYLTSLTVVIGRCTWNPAPAMLSSDDRIQTKMGYRVEAISHALRRAGDSDRAGSHRRERASTGHRRRPSHSAADLT